MTTLKDFVSSTFTDLKTHRARVITLLEGGKLYVDPMEKWNSAGEDPKRYCPDRMKDCALCILLVKHGRGFFQAGPASFDRCGGKQLQVTKQENEKKT